MTTFSVEPTYGAQVKKAPKVRLSVFGDGYQQRVGDGINRTARVWTLNFVGDKSAIDAIDLFLATEDGITSFTWTPPTGAVGKWLCSEWNNAIIEYNHWTLNATFSEVFGE